MLYPKVYYALPQSVVCYALPFTPKCSRLLDTKVYYALPQSIAYYATLYPKA